MSRIQVVRALKDTEELQVLAEETEAGIVVAGIINPDTGTEVVIVFCDKDADAPDELNRCDRPELSVKEKPCVSVFVSQRDETGEFHRFRLVHGQMDKLMEEAEEKTTNEYIVNLMRKLNADSDTALPVEDDE